MVSRRCDAEHSGARSHAGLLVTGFDACLARSRLVNHNSLAVGNMCLLPFPFRAANGADFTDLAVAGVHTCSDDSDFVSAAGGKHQLERGRGNWFGHNRGLHTERRFAE